MNKKPKFKNGDAVSIGAFRGVITKVIVRFEYRVKWPAGSGVYSEGDLRKVKK